MASATYYVVVSFVRDEQGELVAEPAVEVPGQGVAVSRARSLAAKKAGVIAFSRTGDPQAGDFDDAVVLFKAGEIPDDMFGKG